MYKPKYFKAHELVDRQTYTKYGDKSLMLFEDWVLQLLDAFRKAYGKSLSINNYGYGGKRINSGLRALDCKVGAYKSKHKQGIAFDIRAKDMDDLRAFIKKHDTFFQIARVEKFEYTKSWCHIEFANRIVKKTHYFKP